MGINEFDILQINVTFYVGKMIFNVVIENRDGGLKANAICLIRQINPWYDPQKKLQQKVFDFNSLLGSLTSPEKKCSKIGSWESS